jgi:hypothetical protein
MRLKVAVLPLAMLVGAAPVAAATTFDVCGSAAMTSTFKVCASAEVFLNAAGDELSIRVWNRSQVTTPFTSVSDAYTSEWGGWHTITQIGIENVAYSPEIGDYNVQARHYHGAGALTDSKGDKYDLLTKWDDDGGASSLQIKNLGASTANGQKGGIVGCFDPTPNGNANHVATCDTHPDAAYVEFIISGFDSLDLTGALFSFHSQQVATSKCDVTKWKDACTEDSGKGRGPGDESTVPEPMTMILLGTGMAGVGAMRRRRRTQDTV